MKKLIFFYIILIILTGSAWFIKSNGLNLFSKNASKTIAINDKKFNLLTAETDEEKIAGLSGKKNLAKNTGMIFIFNKKDYYSFWMKNMKFPIDIIFIDDQNITDIYKNLQPPGKDTPPLNLTIVKPTKAVNYVLEINAGLTDIYKIKPGDKVRISDLTN